MNDLRTTLLHNWSFMRWLRLILGGYLGVEAILRKDPLSGLVAVFFLYQAITNTGCCGVTSCEAPLKEKETGPEVVQFEEIKSK